MSPVPDAMRRLPMFPLGSVLFPGALLPLHVFEARYRTLVADCLAGDRCFGVVLIERGSEVGGGDERVAVGTEAKVEATRPFDDGRWALLARGRRRIEVVEWLEEAPYPLALVRGRPDEPGTLGDDVLAQVESAVRRVRLLASELGTATAFHEAELAPSDGADHGADAKAALLWRLCQSTPVSAFDRQRLLEAPDVATRGVLLLELALALGDDLGALL